MHTFNTMAKEPSWFTMRGTYLYKKITRHVENSLILLLSKYSVHYTAYYFNDFILLYMY